MLLSPEFCSNTLDSVTVTLVLLCLPYTVCTSAATLFHQLLLGLFRLLQLCGRSCLVLVWSSQLMSAAKRFVSFFLFLFFLPFPQALPPNGILTKQHWRKSNDLMHTWTNEVMTVHTGCLQSQFPLRNLFSGSHGFPFVCTARFELFMAL